MTFYFSVYRLLTDLPLSIAFPMYINAPAQQHYPFPLPAPRPPSSSVPPSTPAPVHRFLHEGKGFLPSFRFATASSSPSPSPYEVKGAARLSTSPALVKSSWDDGPRLHGRDHASAHV